MSYPDYRAEEIRREEADASLFKSVGLLWLARQADRKAKRLQLRGTPAEAGSARAGRYA